MSDLISSADFSDCKQFTIYFTAFRKKQTKNWNKEEVPQNRLKQPNVPLLLPEGVHVTAASVTVRLLQRHRLQINTDEDYQQTDIYVKIKERTTYLWCVCVQSGSCEHSEHPL